jgi:hypothetical protein
VVSIASRACVRGGEVQRGGRDLQIAVSKHTFDCDHRYLPEVDVKLDPSPISPSPVLQMDEAIQKGDRRAQSSAQGHRQADERLSS